MPKRISLSNIIKPDESEYVNASDLEVGLTDAYQPVMSGSAMHARPLPVNMYTYDEDSDYYNDLYTQQSGRVYGDYQIDFLNDFSMAFSDADWVILTDIYAAHEPEISGISSKVLQTLMNQHHGHVDYFSQYGDIPSFLKPKLKEGDIV